MVKGQYGSGGEIRNEKEPQIMRHENMTKKDKPIIASQSPPPSVNERIQTSMSVTTMRVSKR